MELPPYREMPPEVRLRLRSRVLPALAPRSDRRVPYMVAAAVIVVATVAATLLFSPARDTAPPVSLPSSVTPTHTPDHCPSHPSGAWTLGAYLLRSNGDGVQLALEPHTNALGVCLISNGHPTPTTWGQMQLQRMTQGPGTYQAIHDDGLVYGLVSPAVAALTVNGSHAVLAAGTFVAETPTPGPVTLVARDAKGQVLAEGTIS
ncbi:hypothetical protein [Kutzneria sp. NPDC051319]|uniref:hypothetical protein n=1 Tax=Kutzneria sp. NPDC051319 TaxID=3155047 RepID=UPI003425367C